jgi:MarR family transcriptional regulator, lower aerobic nicotinate degradation pathway regulator
MIIMEYTVDMAQAQPPRPHSPAPAAPKTSTADTDLGLLASSGYLLARVGTQSRRRWARMLTEHGLNPSHFALLMALDQLGTASQRQLSHAIGLDPRNAVPLIDALQRHGLLQRHPDPNDRRRHAVALTPTGAALLRRLRRGGEDLERQLLACLDPNEQAALHQLLLKLHHALRDDD